MTPDQQLRQARINNIAPTIRDAFDAGITDPDEIAGMIADAMERRTQAIVRELDAL